MALGLPPPGEGDEPGVIPQGPLLPGEEIPNLEEAYEGDICVKLIDPRELFIDVGANNLQEARWLCIRKGMPVSEVREMFPEMAPFIKIDDEASYGDTSNPVRMGSEYGPAETPKDFTFLYEFHEKPTEQYRKGRILWVCNHQIIREIEHPYYDQFKRFPVFHFGWDRNMGEFWFEPFIAQAWHRQRELNAVESIIREHSELLRAAKILLPLGSRVSGEEITATTAQLISYNPAVGVPKVLEFPPVPQDLWQRGAQLTQDVRQQASVTDSDMGISQSDPNGRAMAIINAESDQQLGPVRRRNNQEWREMHRCLLLMAQMFYPKERLWTVVGPDGVEVYYFQDMNLTPGWDVELEDVDAMSSNPALRMQQAMDLANMGYFMNPQTGQFDKKGFARVAKLKAGDSGYDNEATERAAAAQIPKKIERGEPVMPRSFDDPAVFADTLLHWLRGPGRRADPGVAQQVEQIWQFYVGWLLKGTPMGAYPGGQPQQGGPGQGGPDQSAPGGSSNNPGHLGSDRPVAQEAQQTVSKADRQGERTAKVQSKREG